MKRIILCEGKIDAALLDYLLKNCLQWKFISDHKKHVNKLPTLPVDKNDETLNWYFNGNKELAVWSVNSCNNIKKRFHDVLKFNQIEKEEELRFTKLVILTDHDDRKDQDWLQVITDWYTRYIPDPKIKEVKLKISDPKMIQVGSWVTGELELIKIPTETIEIQLLTIIVPLSGNGNLETFLLQSIETMSSDHKQLVDNADIFINSVPTGITLKQSHKPKAKVGSTFSVLAPDGALQHISQRIPYIKWEKIQLMTNIYTPLEQL